MYFFFYFIDEVESFLEKSLDPLLGETCEREKVLGSVRVDFYLPLGCRKLNYPPCSVIEAVNILRSGSVYHARRNVEKIRLEYDIRGYYLFCEEIVPEYIPIRSSEYVDDIVVVVAFRELESIKKKIFENDDYWLDRQKRVLANAYASFAMGRNTLVLGAGVSKSLGLPLWDELLQGLLDSLKDRRVLSINDKSACLDDSSGSSLIKARYLKSFYTDAKLSMVSDIRKVLYKEIGNNRRLINAIVSLIETKKVETVITYNFDDLLEDALQKKGISNTPVDRTNRPIPGSIPILHTHGFIPRETDKSYDSNVVLSEDEYHSLYMDSFHWANVEQLHALTQTTCFFIGLSLKDPSLRRLLDIASMKGSGNAEHYAFLPRYEYKQPTKAEILYYKMGINVIWFEDVHDLPNLVRSIIHKRSK